VGFSARGGESSVLILLPGSLLLLWIGCWFRRAEIGLGRLSLRGSFVVAYLAFEAILLFITLLLSPFHALTRGWVTVAWTVVVAVSVVWAWPVIGRLESETRRHRIRVRVGRSLRSLSILDIIWLLVIALILGILTYLCVSFLPSNGDSLVYHLARVEHWIQDRTIAPFPTHYLAQVELAPLSEYNLTHLQFLVGTDRLDAFMELLACVVSVVAVSEIARLLGASRSVQIAASVICVTLPSGILVATSTENDYFAAAIGICLLVIILGWSGTSHFWRLGVLLGGAAGLAYMAKGTVLAMIGPAAAFLLVWRLFTDLRPQRSQIRRRSLTLVATGAIAAGIVAGPFVGQNISLFGRPTGPVTASTLSTNLTPAAATANIIRSTAANFMIGNGHRGFGTEVSKVVLDPLHSLFNGLGIKPNDSNYMLGTDSAAFQVTDYTFSDRSPDFGANPIQVALIVVALVALVVLALMRKPRIRLPLLMAVGLIVGFLLFTGTARWSVYNVRYQIPLFVAWSPLIAIAFSRLHLLALNVALVVLTISCYPQLFNNAEEPFIHVSYPPSSLQPYFLDVEHQALLNTRALPYEVVGHTMAESTCHQIALPNWLLVEYPLWVGLHNAGWLGTVQDIDVGNVTARFESSSFRPCAFISQQESGYVSNTSNQVNLQFGNLALAIEPKSAATIQTRVSGLESSVPNVHILPGGGWALGTPGRPTLSGQGSVFIFSSRPERVTVTLSTTGHQAGGQVLVNAPRAGLPIQAVEPSTSFLLHLPRGVTRLDILPVRSSLNVAPPTVDGVVVTG
jgi:hypothetical protein